MRFYVSPESIFPEKNTIEIRDKKEVHHIRDVMRLREGASVNVFDGRNKEYSGDIRRITKNSVVIEIKKGINLKSDISYRVTLYQAISKRTRMDFIIEKAVELGVDRIVPILTERTVPVIGEKHRAKTERWLRISKAASKQCGRITLPVVSDATGFNNALVESKGSDLVIFAALDRDARPLRNILRDAEPKDISVFVGPEGDFSSREIAMAKREGCVISSLGPLVLRVETAALYILSCLSYELN